MIVDATGLVLGRLASVTASHLLKGEDVRIVNAEKAVITGRRESIYAEYGAARARAPKKADRSSQEARHDHKEDCARMLPHKKGRGRDAMSRLRVYIGVPREFAGTELEQPEGAKMRQTSTINYIELGDLSRRLGANF
jgi:large subunit ribosomal protein L13